MLILRGVWRLSDCASPLAALADLAEQSVVQHNNLIVAGEPDDESLLQLADCSTHRFECEAKVVGDFDPG